MNEDVLELRTLELSSVGDLAAVHGAVFPDSVLARLGPEALRRYYRWQLTAAHDLEAFGVFVDGDLVGFLIGGRFKGSMVGFVTHEAPFLAIQVARHPSLLVGARGRAAVGTGLRLLLRPARRSAPERPERVPDRSFGVLVVAVDPMAQRSGVGSTLLDEAERRAAAMGMERLHLTLDPQNGGAAEFYRGRGWRRLGIPGDTPHQWLMGKALELDGRDGDPGP